MGSHSVSTCRGLVHWQGLLLVVSLLTFWSLPATAVIEVWTANVPEGEDARLVIRNRPPGDLGIVWYKGSVVDHRNMLAFYVSKPLFYLRGPEYHGDMIAFDGSLKFKNVTLDEWGLYTAVVHLPDSEKQIAIGYLAVYGRERWVEIMEVYRKRKEQRCKAGVWLDCIP